MRPRSVGIAAAVDRYAGERVRQRRRALGLTQQELAVRLRVSYQQMHKYETGLNRISAGRLFQIAQVLEVSTSFFFEAFECGKTLVVEDAGADLAEVAPPCDLTHLEGTVGPL
jgi:transcriptional regulator with XRE-family HTH domain